MLPILIRIGDFGLPLRKMLGVTHLLKAWKYLQLPKGKENKNCQRSLKVNYYPLDLGLLKLVLVSPLFLIVYGLEPKPFTW